MCLTAAGDFNLVPNIVKQSIHYQKALETSQKIISKTLSKNLNKKRQTDATLFNALGTATFIK